jgi:Tol biopolymer transport system component
MSGGLDSDDVTELYTVQPGGAGRVKVSGSMVAGGDVYNAAWSPDATRIAYMADQEADGRYELYTNLPTGGGSVKVNGTLVANGSLSPDFILWAPNGSRVGYFADQETDGVAELFTSLLGGGGNAKVNGMLVAGGNVTAASWAPDSSRIAYRADQDVNDQIELYTSLPGGGGNVQINGTLAAGNVLGHGWAPNSSRIAYRAAQDSAAFVELYTSLPDGTGNVKVSSVTSTDTLTGFGWAPDSSRIAYVVTTVAGSTYATVHTTLPTGPSMDVIVAGPLGASPLPQATWAPDSSRLAVRAAPYGAVFVQLLVALPTTSTGIVTVSNVDSGIGVWAAAWTLSGTRLVYLADQDIPGVLEAYSTFPNGPAAILKISGPMSQGGANVFSFAVR